jgi:hypothetical protein
MKLDRRAFLVGSALALTSGRHSFAADAATGESAEFISACRRPGGYAVVLLTRDARIVREIPLSARGHDIAVDAANRRAVVFARRPGFFAVAFDLDGRGEPLIFAPEPGRHFFGHGTFAGEGRLLLTSEHDIQTGDGLIGIYDVAAGMKRAGEFPSHGIGPHEAALLPGGKTIVVANGGIATDPALGREEIGLDDMDPSLAFIDVKSGKVLANHKLPRELNRLSIRHLAATPEREVWFGGQWRGGTDETPELIGRASLDSPIRIIEPPAPSGIGLKGYIGSVAMSPDGRTLAASAPRAGRIVFVDTATGRLRGETVLADGCGVAGLGGDMFALSSGLGVIEIEKPGEATQSAVTLAGTEFDNHLRRLS